MECDVGSRHAGSFCCYVTPSPYPLSVHSNTPLSTRVPYHVYGRFESSQLVIYNTRSVTDSLGKTGKWFLSVRGGNPGL